LDWENNLCAQSYDGAACIQGQKVNILKCVHTNRTKIWCFSHILNLVIVDTCDKSTSMRNFFGELQSVISFMRARKRTAIFKEQQIKVYPDQRSVALKFFLQLDGLPTIGKNLENNDLRHRTLEKFVN